MNPTELLAQMLQARIQRLDDKIERLDDRTSGVPAMAAAQGKLEERASDDEKELDSLKSDTAVLIQKVDGMGSMLKWITGLLTALMVAVVGSAVAVIISTQGVAAK